MMEMLKWTNLSLVHFSDRVWSVAVSAGISARCRTAANTGRGLSLCLMEVFGQQDQIL